MHSVRQRNADSRTVQSLSVREASWISTFRPVLIVGTLSILLSAASFLYFYANRMTNVYGDGIAHVNIARKVIDHPDDSLWQRYMQIGTPWLPLQTVLMLPLVANDWMWRTAVAGSIGSMVCFVVATVALYRHASLLYGEEVGLLRPALPALSVAIFALNPSVLYIQSTPMSESVFMASIALACYLLHRWVAQQNTPKLIAAAGAMAVATMSRYEAWPIAAIGVLVVALATRGTIVARIKTSLLFGFGVALGPAYWLSHNWAIYGNAFEFLSGPYSARGIYLQSEGALGWARVLGSSATSALFLMAATVSVCAGPALAAQAFIGGFGLIARRWKSLIAVLPAMLLLVPLVFHTMSVYRGEIQIFPLSAFGLLNVRYGLPHMLAVALFAPAFLTLLRRFPIRRVLAVAGLIVVAQYALLIWEGPSQLAIYQEGYRNGVIAKSARDRAALSKLLSDTPPSPAILMHTGILGPVVPNGGLRFADIIHEGTIRWHQLDAGIPPDVNTVIVDDRDPLYRRFETTPLLRGDLDQEFQLVMSVANVRVFKRIQRMKPS